MRHLTSKEILKRACDERGVKSVADEMGLSSSWLYNQINDPDRGDIIEKISLLSKATGNAKLLHWLCQQQNGYFVEHKVLAKTDSASINMHLSEVLKEFSDVMREIGDAFADGKVTYQEARRIRNEWEEVKSLLESFVIACELESMKEDG